MPPIDEPETAPAPDAPAPDAPAPDAQAASPPAKELYLSTAPLWERHSGAVWSLTSAQAAESGDALKPLPQDPSERAFILAAWGRAPLVRD